METIGYEEVRIGPRGRRPNDWPFHSFSCCPLFASIHHMRTHVLALCLSLLYTRPMHLIAQTHIAPAEVTQTSAATSIEQEKLALERERFAFEKEKSARLAEIEEKKARATIISILIPLTVAVITLIFSVVRQRSDAQQSFILKAADLTMAHRNPGLIKYRAEVLRKLFPSWLPKDFGNSFDPREFYGPNYETKLDLLRLIADKPDNEKRIIFLWNLLFDDTWSKLFAEKLEVAAGDSTPTSAPALATENGSPVSKTPIGASSEVAQTQTRATVESPLGDQNTSDPKSG